MGFSSIAPQAEGNRNQYEAIDTIAMNFDNVIILFDNDDTGVKGAKQLDEYLSMSSKVVFIKNISNVKDISDHVKLYGLDISRNLVNNLINE
jgi:5S rRNA maturation endonuclease (ribonuclease M5)